MALLCSEILKMQGFVGGGGGARFGAGYEGEGGWRCFFRNVGNARVCWREGGGRAIRNGVRNPERVEVEGGWRCFFSQKFGSARVCWGKRGPERGTTQSGTGKRGRGGGAAFSEMLEMQGFVGGGARYGTGYAIRNG